MARRQIDIEALCAGDRRALARAITLVESHRADDRIAARALLKALPTPETSALRIGLSGTPGVGKSTFIEAFGMMLTATGHRVAVLAVDPSSSRSGGSILGDKTRMERLTRDPAAFIRPSPAQSNLGGVARRTREAILLCEAAGFDLILIETVGVGQSETMVADMTDLFLLLLAPGGGDELQGVKRGIMEMADIILVNKADGDLRHTALRTVADYAGALHLLRKRGQDPDGFPKALPVSALEEQGMEAAWTEMQKLMQWRADQGILETARQAQHQRWFEQEIETGLQRRFAESPDVQNEMDQLRSDLRAGIITPDEAAERALDLFLHEVPVYRQ